MRQRAEACACQCRARTGAQQSNTQTSRQYTHNAADSAATTTAAAARQSNPLYLPTCAPVSLGAIEANGAPSSSSAMVDDTMLVPSSSREMAACDAGGECKGDACARTKAGRGLWDLRHVEPLARLDPHVHVLRVADAVVCVGGLNVNRHPVHACKRCC